MPGFEYTIRRRDTLTAIARRYRVEGGWRAIWNDEHNEDLRNRRHSPRRLFAGDRVYIPGASGNRGAAPSGGTAVFTVPPPYQIRAEDGFYPPPTEIPRGGTVRLRAVHDDGEEGDWAWATTSTKITLSDEMTDTVTVTAGNNASAGESAEVVQVMFTPAAEESLPPVEAGITVVGVAFRPSASQGYGFDGMGANAGDRTPRRSTPHISVKKNTRTRVRVVVTGGVDSGVLHFTTDDNTTAEPVVEGAPSASFTLFIDGKEKNKANTLIHARLDSDTGPICASLAVNVYREMSYTAKVAKVWDSTSASTALSRPNFSVNTTQTALRGYYKQAVTTISLTDYSSTGGVVDVHFDPGGAGALVLEAGRTSAGQQAVQAALTGTGKKIVIVKKLSWLFKLGSAAAIGDNRITMASFINETLMGYITAGTYQFGGPGNYENITVTATNRTTKVVTLSGTLTKAHPATEGIWWPLGGLSGNPAYVQEGTDTEAKVNEVIGHEFGHELMRLLDLDHRQSLMYFSNSRTGQEIRFKSLQRHYPDPGGNESQWELISRT